jgi:DNA (cytosine-5)-methyltransferase 1
MLTHIDLFSGIGGFALAAQWAGFRTVVFCEKDEFCQKNLKKNWPQVPIIPEIKKFNGMQYQGAKLLTGGFPCQPFSTAGRKRGKADDRYLWPQMLRIISETRPDWIIGENVIGIAHMVLAECENDLATLGYETQSFDIPACACGLSTMERHIWIVAASLRKHMEGRAEKCLSGEKKNRLSIGRPDNPGFERFFGKPDLCEPILYRSRKGIPNFMDRHRALGNAIIPQVAYEIIKRIADIKNE